MDLNKIQEKLNNIGNIPTNKKSNKEEVKEEVKEETVETPVIEEQAKETRESLVKRYIDKYNKKPFAGWSDEVLKSKL